MSRGLSKLQNRIVDLVEGRVPARERVYGGTVLTTLELVVELASEGFLPDGMPGGRKQEQFTVRRACRSLERRGRIRCEGRFRDDAGKLVLTWSAARESAETRRSP